MNPAINPSMLLGAGLAPPPQPNGGSAAIAQLMAMRSEVLTMHLSVKLFHCTPQELPEDAQEQLTAWLRAAPACTELYIRSGCIHLTLTVHALGSLRSWSRLLQTGGHELLTSCFEQASWNSNWHHKRAGDPAVIPITTGAPCPLVRPV